MHQQINLNKTKLNVWGEYSALDLIKKDAELFYVIDGNVKLDVDGVRHKLSREDVYIVNSGARYSCKASKDALFVTLSLSYDLISSNSGLLFVCDSTQVDTAKYSELRVMLKKVMFRNLQKGNEDRINFGETAAYFELVELLVSKFTVEKWSANDTKVKKTDEYRKSMIESYMFENYESPVSLRSMAEYLGLSEAYLSRTFKKIYNVNFTTMLKDIRLAEAMEELLFTNNSITHISFDCGFSNSSYFNRVFKEKYGKNPTEFRKSNLSVEKDNTYKQKMEKLAKYVQKSWSDNLSGENKRKYEVDTTKDEVMVPAWNQLVNGGSAVALLRSGSQKKIEGLRVDFRFKYIRCWSLFSKEMNINPLDDNGQYNFVKLDELFDFIISSDMKPFIDLDEKEKQVHKENTYSALYDEKIIFDTPLQWSRLFEAMMRHWVKRYGIDEVSQWKIEVWYDGIKIRGMDPMTNYFTVFSITHNIVKKYVSELQIGGCGYWEDFSLRYSERRKCFWREWTKNAPKPDFVSFISYAYEDEPDTNTYTRKSTDSEFLLHSIDRIKEELKLSGWEDIEVIVSEWDLTVSDRNFLNDSCFKAAYIVKNMIDTVNKLNVIGYYNAMDLTSEYYNTKGVLYGGNGLLSKDGISKPSAYAIRFLNKLYPFVCDRGENYIVTRNRRGRYGIICHNMKPLNHYYYNNPENYIAKEDVWKCFDDTSDLELEIVLKGVENTEYRIRTEQVNNQNGSVLDSWREMQYYEELKKDDIQYLKSVSVPKLSIEFQRTMEYELFLKIRLKANEIVFIRIEEEI